MAYADYNYYVNNYNGSAISENNFDYLSERASDFMDSITFNRLKAKEYPEFFDRIKKCCCALAEIVGNYENSRNNNIASEKIGSYSVTYSSADSKAYQAHMKNVANLYLGDTGLTYRGVD